MAVKRRMSVAEIIQAWEGGLLTRGEVPERLMMIINEENIDEIIARLTPEVRDDFIETAATHYAGGELIEMRPELQEEPFPAEALVAVRNWLRRNGLMREDIDN